MSNLVELAIERPNLPAIVDAPAELAFAQAFRISTPEQLALAVDQFNLYRERRDFLEAIRVRQKKGILEAGREIDDFWQPPIKAYANSADALGREIARYQRDEEHKSKEHELKIREAQRRVEEQINKEADELRAKADIEAQKLEANGKPEQALMVRAEIEQEVQDKLKLVSRMPELPPVPKAEGLTVRKRWHMEVQSLADLIRAVADGRCPIMFVLPNEPKLNQTAQMLGAEANVPGCIPVCEETVARKAKR